MQMQCSECGTAVQAGEDVIKVTCAICVCKAGAYRAPEENKKPRRIPASVRSLVAKECANHWQGKHWGERACTVLAGQRCGYFERAVLPAGAEPAVLGYERMLPNAAGKVRRALQLHSGRYCECGALLPKRRRWCDHCAGAKRRKSKRDAARRRRSSKPVDS